MASSEGEFLTLEGLVLADQDIEPYILQWPGVVELDGDSEVYVLALMRRQDGVMLALPEGVLSDTDLEIGNQGMDSGSLIGYSNSFEVPGVVIDGGSLNPSGTTVRVVVVDFPSDVVQHMRSPRAFEEIAYGFDPESPFLLPEPKALLDAVIIWIQDSGPLSALNYYTAVSEDLSSVERHSGVRPAAKRPSRRKASPGEATPGAKPPEKERPKRVTTASLAEGMQSLMDMLPQLNVQMKQLADRQSRLENQALAPVSASCPALVQPLSRSMKGPALAPSAIAAGLQSPPRTSCMMNPGLLGSAQIRGSAIPPELSELEKEKSLSHVQANGDPLARAVLAQSEALTSLVNQIAHQTSDPMMDLGVGTSTGTRGTAGRARLQQELASQQGLFFNSVMQAMARRMQPSLPVQGTPMQLMEKGVCGTRYLERFGGYGRHRDLGQLQYQVMTVLDHLQTENLQAARDATALLAVTLEQAVMDNGRFDLAAVLCLQDDLPAGVFMNRSAGALSRTKSFAPLADQRWITTALAYLKELDAIQTKRVELAAPSKQTEKSSESSSAKQKASGKKKGRGKGQSQQQIHQTGEEES